MALEAGTRLGPYEIVAPLGAGGMGEVYRARDTRLDRTVAIKILGSQLAEDAGLRARFEREAKVISQLQHSNICTLHDVGSEAGTDFLVMEYLEGQTLSEHLRKGPMPTAQLVQTAVEIAAALEAAHRAGVVHRDLKPGNVMLTKSGAKLLDFGLAKPLGITTAAGEPKSQSVFAAAMTMTSPASPLSTAGTLIGTVQYMAPEQIGGQEADARSDIFAFGMLLFEMATGKRAFEGKTQASVVGAILAVEPPAITTLQPNAPRALERLVRICLAKDPDERFQSVHDLKMELENVAQAPEASAVGATPSTRRERIAWAAAAIALLLALGLAGVLLFRPSPRAAVISATLLPPKGVQVAPTEIALSPDGTRIAFVGEKQNTRSLYVRPLSSADAQPVNQTDGAAYPFWSADSQSLGFFAEGKLKKVELATGASVVLADAPAGRGGAWSEDNQIVFTANATGPLSMVSATGGAVSVLTKPPTDNTSHRWPQFLPGGRFLLYWMAANRTTGAVSGEPNDKATGAYLLDWKTRESRLLLQTDSGAIYAGGYLLYIWQGNLMAQRLDPARGKLSGAASLVAQKVIFDSDRWIGGFSASGSGLLALISGSQLLPTQLAWVDRTGKELAKIGEPASLYWPALSPDGKRIAFVRDTGHLMSVWTFDLERASKGRFNFEETSSQGVVWSPDGKRLTYSLDPPVGALLSKDSSGLGQAEKLVESPLPMYPSQWNSDGRTLLYGMLEGTQNGNSLWVYSAAEKKSTRLPLGGILAGQGKISPDGKWLAYVSRESGASEVYVVPFPELNGKWEISTAGGDYPQWNPNGKELFYLSADRKLMAVEINTNGGFKAGIPKALFALNLTAFPGYQYDVSRDGRFLMNNRTEQGTAEPITIVTNWTAGLKQ